MLQILLFVFCLILAVRIAESLVKIGKNARLYKDILDLRRQQPREDGIIEVAFEKMRSVTE